MANNVRMRCPCCGMLVWQDRLNRDYAFELARQEIWSEGRGRIRNRYHFALAADSDDARMFQGLLALKMASKAKRLLREIDADIDIQVCHPSEAEPADERPDTHEQFEEYEVVPDWELEYTVHAGFEAMADVEISDTRWSFRRWLKSRRGKRVRDISRLPDLEVEVLAEIEVDAYGEAEDY